MRRFNNGARVVFGNGAPSGFAHSWEVLEYQPDGKVMLSGPGACDSLTYADESELAEFAINARNGGSK